MLRNRRTNLALASRKVASGSSLRWRATFAMTKSKSPNSSATFFEARAPLSGCPPASAAFSSAISSSALASTGASDGQSNPTLAARDCSFTARDSAGRASGTSSRSEPALAGVLAALSLLLGLNPLPGAAAHEGGPEARIFEHTRVPADHLRGDGVDNVGKGKASVLLRHARVIHDLQQEIAELIFERLEIASRDRVSDLVRLLNGVAPDRSKGLLAIPRTTRLRIAQSRHHTKQIFDAIGPAYVVRHGEGAPKRREDRLFP